MSTTAITFWRVLDNGESIAGPSMTFEQAEAARQALVTLHPDGYIVRFTRFFNLSRETDRNDLDVLMGSI